MLTLTILTISLAKSTSTASIFVEPETCNVAGLGQTFTINITVANVTDLWGWEFKLFYDSIQLNGTALVEGPFLQTAGETFFWEVNFTDNYNATHGFVWVIATLLGSEEPPKNGSGVLTTITFNATTLGESSPLVLYYPGFGYPVKLSDSDANSIPCTAVDGTVEVVP